MKLNTRLYYYLFIYLYKKRSSSFVLDIAVVLLHFNSKNLTKYMTSHNKLIGKYQKYIVKIYNSHEESRN